MGQFHAQFSFPLQLETRKDRIWQHGQRGPGEQRCVPRSTAAFQFLAQPENAQALYRVFSSLLDQKLAEFQLAAGRSPPSSAHAPGGDEIGDDYLSIIRPRADNVDSVSDYLRPGGASAADGADGLQRRGSHPAIPFFNSANGARRL